MPAYMSHDAALNNLREDARFYTLRTLIGPLAPAVNGAGVRRAMALNDEEGEWQIVYVSPTTGARRRSVPGPIAARMSTYPRSSTLDETRVRRMTIYGHASAQLHIENAMHRCSRRAP